MNATERSIFEQFGYWEMANLPDAMTDRTSRYVVIGCGTSYNLALSIAAILCSRGFDAVAVPAGEWLSRPSSYANQQPSNLKVIALSRSGETTETVNAAAASRRRGIEVTSLTCASPCSLADNSDRTLYFETHPDEGIVMTSSASLMLMGAMALAGVPFTPGFHEPASALLARFAETDLGILDGRSHIVFLGGGALYGIALEACLKLQEMSLSFSQAFHPLEYRHGPISLVDEHFAALMLFNPPTRADEESVIVDVLAKGGAVIGLDGTRSSVSGSGGDSLNLGVDGSADHLPLTVLPALQFFGESVARKKNLDTTAPRHLTKVVVLDT